MTVLEPPGSAAILAASGAGETPALPGKAGPKVRCGAFLCKMSIAVGSRVPAVPAEGPSWAPRSACCDQEVNERTDVAPRKVREEVSKKETRNHFEPCDAQVSLPGRADESSEVRSFGDNVPTSASLDVEVDEGRPVRLNAREESS